MTTPIPPAPALVPVPDAEDERPTPRLDALMRPSEDDNPFKLVARYRKARKVADALLSIHAATPENVAELAHSETARSMAAQLAGTHVPSETTWALVVELVKEASG